MVGNKAQKAVAAALTGMLAMGSVAPAFAGVKEDAGWYRINGDHAVNYTLMLDVDKTGSGTSGSVSGLERVKGEDRYDTAFDAIDYNATTATVQNAAMANVTPWQVGSVSKIVLASGQSQADSLVASGLAGMLTANLGRQQADKGKVPVMITKGDALSIQAKRAITAYYKAWADKGDGSEFTVYLVGGEAALSADVEKAIKDLKDDLDLDVDIKVKRYAGDDRQGTSLQVAKMNAKYLSDEEGGKHVFVANGKAWPDALSVSSFAYSWGMPILLTGADGKLTDEQVDYLLGVDESITVNVIGGPAAPSAEQLYDAGFTRARVQYIGGVDRYETSAKVVEEFGVGKTIAVANGEGSHWADALIGGPFVGANEGTLVLVNDLDNVVALKEAYQQLNGNKDKGYVMGRAAFIMGGKAALSEDFADMLADEFVWARNQA